MSGTIMSGRRGGVRLFSAIGVTYPAGSVCTCTKGTKTYKAKNTSGLALFAVPEVGEWTITCSDGISTATKTVSITSEGQIETVVLAYGLYLYDAGNEYTSITGGWSRASPPRSACPRACGGRWPAWPYSCWRRTAG